MTFVFELSEADTEKAAELYRGCLGVPGYESLTANFFSQLSEQERRQRKAAMAQLSEWKEDCCP